MDSKYIKSQIVLSNPVLANSIQLRIQFPTQVFLRSKLIDSIESFSVVDMTVTPNGTVLPTAANMQQCFVTFYSNDPEVTDNQVYGDYVQQFPILSFHRMNNRTDPYVFELPKFDPRYIVWEKSFIDFIPSVANATLGNTATLQFMFNVGYHGLGGDN